MLEIVAKMSKSSGLSGNDINFEFVKTPAAPQDFDKVEDCGVPTTRVCWSLLELFEATPELQDAQLSFRDFMRASLYDD